MTKQEIEIVLKRVEKCLPENPYPKDLFPMTTEDYAKAIPEPNMRTAVSGCIGRWMFDLNKRVFLENIQHEFED